VTRRDVSHIGRYEIQRRLGTGGMGDLYLARDPSLDRFVAIKLLKEHSQDDPELRERFIREARSVAKLRHPNIVVVHDVGEDDGRPFIAMEYIAGETLTEVLRRTPTLPLVRRLELMEHLCAGLAHAHTAGIVHRDIKPANIMLDGEGVLKILDFGIARLGNSGMTQEGMMMGTLNYMSPEQVAGRGVDKGTDIFAVGAVLYEVIALEQAFPGRIDTGILNKILNEGPVPLEQRVPGIDPELVAIVRKALDPDVTRRYHDCNVLRLDLARVRRRLVENEHAAVANFDRDTTLNESPRPTPPKPGSRVDSGGVRRLSPERAAELRRQQVEEHLRFGEEAFARGEHDAALHHAERAATVDPDSREAIDLIDRARLAIEGKAIRQLLADAQQLLADGHLDEAAALAEEASATLPNIHGAADLRREVRQAVDKIAAVRQREQRIAATLDRAQQSLDQGAYDTALRAVYEVLALDPESPKARALEQQAKALLQAQRERERARRDAYERLARAESLTAKGEYDAALAEISAVSPPSDTVRLAAAAALTAVRNAQRRAEHEAILAKAQAAFDRGDFEDAQTAIEGIPGDERTARASALRVEVAKAIEAQRQLKQRQQALEIALKTIEGLIEQNNLPRALEQLDEAAAIGPDDPRIGTLRRKIADLVAEAENKRRQEARDRVAAKRVEAAQRLLANGDGYAAIALLERDGTGHPLVEQTLRDIRVAVAEHEERVRKEAERRRQEEARRRAEAEALKKVEEERKAEEARKAEEKHRQQEEERRQREEQRRRQREEVATLILSAEQALAARRPEEATLILGRVDQQVASAEDTDLRQRALAARSEAERLAREHEKEKRRQEEEARRREEEARRREHALQQILTRVGATVDHEAALKLLDEAQALTPQDGRVQTLVQERRAALALQRAEEARRKEEARREQEEQRARAERARQQAEAEAARLREQQRVQAEQRRREQAEQQRREQEERQRRDEIERLMTSAERTLIAGQPDEAAGWIEQAETVRVGRDDIELTRRLDAARTELTRLRERLAAEERERLEQQARDAEAARIGDRARQLFASGQHDQALALLRESPGHATTRKVFEELEARRAELERQRERAERRRLRQERRAAAIFALGKFVSDRRVHILGAVVVSVTIGWVVWQSLPTSSPRVEPVEVRPEPAPGPTEPERNVPAPTPSNPPEAVPPVVPPSVAPPGPVPSGRNPQPGRDNPPVTRGRGPNESSAKPATVPPVVPAEPAASNPKIGPPQADPSTSKSVDPVAQKPPEPIEPPISVNPPPQNPIPAPQQPPPAPQPDLAAERAAIQQLLNRYVAAYIALDEAQLKSIDPGFSGIRNRMLIKSLELRVSNVSIEVLPDGETANLRATQTFTVVFNRPLTGPPPTGVLSWRLRKIGETWRVLP
jgi:hypothetical protein